VTACAALLVAGALLTLATDAAAQARPVPPRPGQQTRPGARVPPRDSARLQRPGIARDTIPPDSSAADTASFSRSDPVMEELLKKPGYTVTRYEGNVVTFDALNKAFAIAAAAANRAMVEREGQRVVTDSVIVYDDRTRTVNVSGSFQIAPGEGQPPIAGSGTAQYNLTERSGRLTNAAVTVDESGERWFIRSEIGKTALGDSTRGIPQRFYGLGGTLTSCDDSIPDYHFRLREIKRSEKTLVARPAVLYIRDIPVMWLPFVFQDIRPGRRSGILPPRFGFAELVRQNPNYRRHVENVGYYWAMNDYMDAATWFDWRSGTGADSLDPGWMTLNGEMKYSWMSRFLNGRLASKYTRQNDGDGNFGVSWGHQQRFGRSRMFTADVNYVTDTRIQRQRTYSPVQAMATISSNATYSEKIGPMSLSLGGSRTQYPGRRTVTQSLPTLTLSSTPLALGAWLLWTPSFRFAEAATLNSDQVGTFGLRFVPGPNGQAIRIDTIKADRFQRDISFGTPLTIFGYNLDNSFTIRDELNDFPSDGFILPGGDTTLKEPRVFRRTFKTGVDWNPTIALPPLLQNRFKITPSVSLSNVAGGPYWVRSHLNGGRWVSQTKRLSYGVSASPAIFGLLPGFGPFRRIRHAISPSLSYSFAPAARVSNEYLQAIGQQRQGYLGSLQQNAVTFGLSQNFEAKVRSDADTAGGSVEGQKLTLLNMTFTSLTYDFERARVTGRRLAGLTTENFGTRITSDLLPGMDIAVDYSLFQGSPQTDTAEFKPFLTRIASTFRIGQEQNPLAVISKLMGRAIPEQSPLPRPGVPIPQEVRPLARQIASQPVAGQGARGEQFVTPPARGWEATFSFTTARFRRPKGDRFIVVDPRERCEPFRDVNPLAYTLCRQNPTADDTLPRVTPDAPIVVMPTQTSLTSNLSFALTPKWAASWNTSYDFVEHEFASHIVSLQRDLHDWRAVFSFTQSPNGNFAFTFFIALKAQPDLKFDYSRASYRR
jgi:lipopolysaccharide transport LptD-like protein